MPLRPAKDSGNHTRRLQETVQRFRVKPYGESMTNLGIVYIVQEDHGKCGCGLCDMVADVAWFGSLPEAHLYCDWKNGQVPKGAVEANWCLTCTQLLPQCKCYWDEKRRTANKTAGSPKLPPDGQ